MIIIECPNCHARYQYDEERFERKPSKKIKCAKCATIFEIQNPAFAPQPVAPDVFERTFTRRDEPASKLKQETTEQSPLPEKSTTDKVPVELQLPRGKRISLAVIAGPDGGSVYRIEKPRVTIGRASADLTLNDTEASRLHAAIEVRDVAILLRDLGSTNGTLVDGQRINDAVELQDKSEFQIGATVLMLIVTEDA